MVVCDFVIPLPVVPYQVYSSPLIRIIQEASLLPGSRIKAELDMNNAG